MGTMVDFASNGNTASGYLALPGSGSGPGVIVVQEWWGLDSGTKEMTDRLAAAGFVALAPDLYHGELAGPTVEHELHDFVANGLLVHNKSPPTTRCDPDAGPTYTCSCSPGFTPISSCIDGRLECDCSARSDAGVSDAGTTDGGVDGGP